MCISPLFSILYFLDYLQHVRRGDAYNIFDLKLHAVTKHFEIFDIIKFMEFRVYRLYFLFSIFSATGNTWVGAIPIIQLI